MSLQEFRDMLLTVTDAIYHFEAMQEKDEYIVWQEMKGHSLHASDYRCEVAKKVQVDLYTKTEFSPTLDRLINVLIENDVAFEEPVPTYEADTSQFRYIIECEVV